MQITPAIWGWPFIPNKKQTGLYYVPIYSPCDSLLITVTKSGSEEPSRRGNYGYARITPASMRSNGLVNEPLWQADSAAYLIPAAHLELPWSVGAQSPSQTVQKNVSLTQMLPGRDGPERRISMVSTGPQKRFMRLSRCIFLLACMRHQPRHAVPI